MTEGLLPGAASVRTPTGGLQEWGHSRIAIERMKRLAALLRHELPFTCSEIAGELETCRKTIVRDIAFMRDRLGWDIEYDSSARKYRLLKAPAPQL